MKSFCISLEKNKDRWGEILDKIRNVGFEDVEIFPGVNGNEIGKMNEGEDVSERTKSLVDQLGGISKIVSPWCLYLLKKGIKRKDHSQISSWGAIGCYLSHVLLWIRMVEEGLPYCAIFEDDVNFSENFNKKFEESLKFVPEDADTIFLGVSNNFDHEKYNDHFYKIKGLFFGLHAYIITNKCAQKLLERVFPIEVQIDSTMSFLASLEDMKFYEIQGLCSQGLHVSSIQKKCLVCDLDERKIDFILLVYFLMVCVIIFLIIRLSNVQE